MAGFDPRKDWDLGGVDIRFVFRWLNLALKMRKNADGFLSNPELKYMPVWSLANIVALVI